MEISQVSRPKAGKTATSFGSSKRFTGESKPAPPPALGPGSYNVGFQFGKKTKAAKQQKVKDELRCPSLINNNVKIPGPGSY